ncbi:D-alanyl-D-alanine carboxypeptidase [Microbacterium sp. NEAU-LLC]|uniref:D-alanyl-D-alanine carboxypeptidase n=1 Tax=Microbacterium helvum TaxID=2773713 RepID=A0ABR8NPQ5_9MICO|nr:D-alanyl-D-alanine carboxypeptidase [Microbacterium helvum]MBD3942164.1 D-alanyl-D-alanine carboxypeptidase [Microbacterium helvum]
MTPDDAPAPSRRERRVRTGEVMTAPEGALTAPSAGAAASAPRTTSTVPVDTAAVPTSIATAPLGEATASSALPMFAPPAATTDAAPGAASPVPAATPDAAEDGLAGETVPLDDLDLGPVDTDALLVTAPDAASAPVAPLPSDGTALSWVDPATVGRVGAPGDLAAAATPYIAVETDLLADAPRRSPLRAGVIVPTLAIAGVLAAYAGTTLLWPLNAVEPTITPIQAQPVAAPAAVPAWPAEGSAAEAVEGIGTLASTPDADAIASITKVVTALVVLDELPLAVGEQGPSYRFTSADSSAYWQYLRNGESALDVPVGGSLSEYQMLQGMLIGSAGNYADRLAQDLFPSDAVYASAANKWLTDHGVPGITLYEPTGIDKRNRASAESLIPLAQKALENPVIAEIVAQKSVVLPGAGTVENTNELLADPGVVGIKTGTLDAWNLLSAKDVTIGDTTVRLYASVLGQPDDDARLAASRAIYAQLEQELQLRPSVAAGTVAGIVETRWGDKVDVVSSGDASVILWNGGVGTATTTFDLGDARAEGDTVGRLQVTGSLDDTTVDLTLAADVSDPSPWWRLTHPLDLFGLND